MSDRYPEMIAKLDLVIAAQQEQRRDLQEQRKILGEHGTALQEQTKAIQEQGKAIARVEGQLSVALQWLQSMDARFVASMHPYEPQKSAA